MYCCTHPREDLRPPEHCCGDTFVSVLNGTICPHIPQEAKRGSRSQFLRLPFPPMPLLMTTNPQGGDVKYQRVCLFGKET